MVADKRMRTFFRHEGMLSNKGPVTIAAPSAYQLFIRCPYLLALPRVYHIIILDKNRIESDE